MFYKLFVIIVLVFDIFYAQLVFSADSVVLQLRRDRQIKHQAFIDSANQFTQCSEELWSLVGQIDVLHESVLSKGVICDEINSSDKYKECIGLISQSISDLKNLKSVVLDAQRRCPLFNSRSSVNKLTGLIDSLESDLITLNERYKYVVMDENVKVAVYDRNKLSKCYTSLQNLSSRIYLWIDRINLNLVGFSRDLYPVTQGLSALEIYEDYFLNIKDICLKTADPEKTRDHETYVGLIENKYNEIKEAIATVFGNHENFPFEENATMMCTELTSDTDHASYSVIEGLCQEPLNNPSWIYSAHYFLTEKQDSL